MSKPRALLVWSLLAVLVAVAVVVTPYWVMRPFRPQGPLEVELALWTLRAAPWLLAGALLLGLWVLVRAWSRGWSRRLPAALALVVVGLAAFGSRINLFEQMFAPMTGATFVAAVGAPLPADDVVMAVYVGDVARAYPVRIMAYHHLLNDSLGGAPLVVTY